MNSRIEEGEIVPIEFTIGEPDHEIHTRIFGEVREADLFGYLGAVVTDENYRAHSTALIECFNARLVNITPRTITRFAAYTKIIESSLEGSSVAVVTSQPVVFGFARMYQNYRKPPYRFSVFRRESEARRWLSQHVY